MSQYDRGRSPQHRGDISMNPCTKRKIETSHPVNPSPRIKVVLGDLVNNLMVVGVKRITIRNSRIWRSAPQKHFQRRTILRHIYRIELSLSILDQSKTEQVRRLQIIDNQTTGRKILLRSERIPEYEHSHRLPYDHKYI